MLYISIKIYGQVQGVLFRQSAKRKADELNIAGWVKNIPDGSVYIEAEGEKEKLEKFLSWCHKGSIWSKVERVEHESDDKLRGFDNFEIKY